MPKLTEDMKAMVANNQCFIATVSAEGYPNIGPKRSTRVFDDEHLAFNEGTGGQTFANIQANGIVLVAVVDAPKLEGYRFAGRGEVLKEGALYDAAKEAMAQRGLPGPKAVIKVKVEKIYSLKPGPTAGKLIAE